MIGTSLPDKTPIDRAGLNDVFEVASALDVPLLLHPNDPDVPMLDDFHLANAVGNPLDTTTAAARLILSGTLDAFPQLKIVLVHAGGFLPYQLGRLDRVARVREDAGRNVANAPTEYLGRFWIDSITHSIPALRYLAERVGTERLLLGSDYPFDMQDPDPVGSVTSAGLDPHVLGAAAQRLFAARGR
jgi:aminocarboxymuconate-semialdehyde decarboxylase